MQSTYAVLVLKTLSEKICHPFYTMQNVIISYNFQKTTHSFMGKASDTTTISFFIIAQDSNIR